MKKIFQRQNSVICNLGLGGCFSHTHTHTGLWCDTSLAGTNKMSQADQQSALYVDLIASLQNKKASADGAV